MRIDRFPLASFSENRVAGFRTNVFVILRVSSSCRPLNKARQKESKRERERERLREKRIIKKFSISQKRATYFETDLYTNSLFEISIKKKTNSAIKSCVVCESSRRS